MYARKLFLSCSYKLGHEKMGMTNDVRWSMMTMFHCIRAYYYTIQTLFFMCDFKYKILNIRDAGGYRMIVAYECWHTLGNA